MKKNLLLLFASLAVCFLVAETLLEKNGKYLSYNERTSGHTYQSPFDSGDDGWIVRNQPFEKVEDIKTEYSTSWIANNEGLRDAPITKNKNGVRLMLFGDSFTEGAGAPNDSCYPRVLEKLLRTNCDSTLQVINCGISSADIFTEYLFLKLKMIHYRPDYVCVAINPTDFFEFITRGGFERFVAGNRVQYRSAPWYEFFYAHSHIVRHLVHDGFGYGYDFLKPEERQILLEEGEKAIAAAIDSFQLLCTTHGVRLGILFHPLNFDIIQPANYRMQYLMNHCKIKKIPYTDFLSYLNTHGIDGTNCNGIFWPLDGHLNSKGYTFLAECVYTFLENEILLQCVHEQTNDTASIK